jgi:hypothetical protein
MTRTASYYLLCLLLIGGAAVASAQNYQAIHGSSQAGALGVANNPASAVHVPFAWDITPFSVQAKQATNAFTIKKYSLLSSPKNLELHANMGDLKRFLFANQDIHLLNARIRLDPKQAIAFGMNIRAYTYAKVTSFNWQDTIASLRSFIRINTQNVPMSAEIRSMAWAEIFGTYARTIREDADGILNAGITVKVTRGLAAMYTDIKELGVRSATVNGKPGFILPSGELQYGYSANLDAVEGEGGFGTKMKRLIQPTYSSIGASLGIEYIMPAILKDDEANEYNYDWKIGVSILDIGFNNYRNSNNSRTVKLDRDDVSDSLVEKRFENINSVEDFNDSVATIGTASLRSGDFQVYQPARLVVNVDKHLTGRFYLNGEVSILLASLGASTKYMMRDVNMLAVTPRYETKTVGLYLPVTVTSQGQFWMGGAFKAGPLLFGVHNWANLFGKNKIQNGGLYLALTFRPGKKHDGTSRTPKEKMTKAQRRQLECATRF